MKKCFLLISFCLLGFFRLACADTLLQVYRQALQHDPAFKQAEFDWLSTRQNLPIALANYLPQINITGDVDRVFFDDSRTVVGSATSANGWNDQLSYTVSLTQPVFNLPAWEGIKQANDQAKAALATYLFEAQDLMVRTSTAYFDVLRAMAKLEFTIANKKAVYQQLVTAEQKFKVGLIAITGVYDAQAVYDQAVASEISDRNNLMNQLENLRAITGRHYLFLDEIKKQVPLIAPTPNNINRWVSTAEQQNYNIRAQRYTVLASKDNIKVQSTARYPTVDFGGSWQDLYNLENQNGQRNYDVGTATFGFSVNFTPYQGGGIYARTKQAEYQYLSSSSQLVFTDRDVVKTTRQSFLGVITGISRVKADVQAIKSAQNALEATKAGYVVGTRTMVDVLNDLQSLYQRKQTYADDQYNYLQNIISLNSSAGTLSVKDLARISSWLKLRTRLPLSKKFYPDLIRANAHATKVYNARQRKLKAKQKKSSSDVNSMMPPPLTPPSDDMGGPDGNGGVPGTTEPRIPDLSAPTPTPPSTTTNPTAPLQPNQLPRQLAPANPGATTTPSTSPSTTIPNNTAPFAPNNSSPSVQTPKLTTPITNVPNSSTKTEPVTKIPAPTIAPSYTTPPTTLPKPPETRAPSPSIPNEDFKSEDLPKPDLSIPKTVIPQQQQQAPAPNQQAPSTTPSNVPDDSYVSPSGAMLLPHHKSATARVTELLNWRPNRPAQETRQNLQPLSPIHVAPDKAKSVTHNNHHAVSAVSNKKIYYAIQLYNSPKKDLALQYMKQHQDIGTLYVVKSRQRYKVVYGKYHTVKAAQHAIEHLPNQFTKHKVWITRILQQ